MGHSMQHVVASGEPVPGLQVDRVHLHVPLLQVAIKKVLQDKRFKNRELQIMKMTRHPNVVALKHCFYSNTEKDEVRTCASCWTQAVPTGARSDTCTWASGLFSVARSRRTAPARLINEYMTESI